MLGQGNHGTQIITTEQNKYETRRRHYHSHTYTHLTHPDAKMTCVNGHKHQITYEKQKDFK